MSYNGVNLAAEVAALFYTDCEWYLPRKYELAQKLIAQGGGPRRIVAPKPGATSPSAELLL